MKIYNFFISLFYKGIDVTIYSKKKLLLYIFIQKIVGINRSIPWPVHWSSMVNDYKKIKRDTLAIGFMPGCYIDARNGIEFGKNVIVGPHVSIISQNHDVHNFDNYVIASPIIIESNSWIGSNVIILPSVHLGEHTVVAAGAVVTKSFPEGNQIIGGNPARIIKKLSDYSPQKA